MYKLIQSQTHEINLSIGQDCSYINQPKEEVALIMLDAKGCDKKIERGNFTLSKISLQRLQLKNE